MSTSISPAESSHLASLVLAMWREVLIDGSVGPHDDFFLSGGHSLLAVQLAARLADATGADVPPGLLFLHPTPAELTAALTELLDARDGSLDNR